MYMTVCMYHFGYLYILAIINIHFSFLQCNYILRIYYGVVKVYK